MEKRDGVAARGREIEGLPILAGRATARINIGVEASVVNMRVATCVVRRSFPVLLWAPLA